jgi:Mn-containing catalase
MTREVAHFQMFEAALETIQPNFPPAFCKAIRDTAIYISI